MEDLFEHFKEYLGGKREGTITNHDAGMLTAYVWSLKSKDPNTQVGACIVNPLKRIVGVGYNGMPYGCDDSSFPWTNKQGELHETKYAYVVHAELNAILNATSSLKGCTLYVTLYPCNECTKSILQSGIKEIVFEDNKYEGKDFDLASKKMLQSANVKVRQFKAEPITFD